MRTFVSLLGGLAVLNRLKTVVTKADHSHAAA
jgi:hypothetical protein